METALFQTDLTESAQFQTYQSFRTGLWSTTHGWFYGSKKKKKLLMVEMSRSSQPQVKVF